MHLGRLSLRFAKPPVARAICATLAIVGLSAIAYAAVTAKATLDDRDPFAQHLMAQALTSVDDLATRVNEEQDFYLRITPPDPEFVLRQSAGLVAFDAKTLPEEFVSALVPTMNRGCPIYRVTVAEDPDTRDLVVYNADDKAIYAIHPYKDYDPYRLLNQLHPDLASNRYTPEQAAWLKLIYDPARVQIVLNLLPSEYVDTFAESVAADRAALAQSAPSVLLRYEGPPVTNLFLAAIESQTNGMLLTLAYPSGFTNRVDFFTCADLVAGWWDLAATTNVNTSTNWIEWLDPASVAIRFYAVGTADTNAVTDPDGDGLTWAREKFMYHTSPTNWDTDTDGLSDYEEVINRHTDPNNSDTNLPTVSILFPSNGSGKVWLP
jgi:hypothetical protein